VSDHVRVPFAEINHALGNNINPFEFPDEEFELYSVPAHEKGRPEVAVGVTIGSNKQLVSEGMVLLCKINPRINRVWVVKPETGRRQIASTEWIAFERSAFILPEYLASFLRQTEVRDFLAANASGVGSSLMRVKPATLAAYEFTLTGLKTQTRIIKKLEELLSDLDAGVAELKAAQKKLAQYRQSLLKAAVEGALTAEWRAKHTPTETGAQLLERILTERRARWEAKQLAKLKEQGDLPPKGWQKKYPVPVPPDTTNLPELPEGWYYCHLEALIAPDRTATKTGPFGSMLKKHEHKAEGIPVIGIENIHRMRFISGSKIHISSEKAVDLSDYDLLSGDVVISRSGTIGEVCVIPGYLGNARFSTNIMRVRLESIVIRPEYFCFLLSGSPSVLNQIRKLCSGSTRDFLNTEILKTLIFPVPIISEQDEILAMLDTALTESEKQSQAIQLSLKQSTAQRQNILRAAFAGQLVPQDPNDEPASVLLERIRAERLVRASSRNNKHSAAHAGRKPKC